MRSRLAAATGVNEDGIELVVIRTTGDAIQDRPLAEEGGKGLFTKEIEEALLDERVDLAVHSAKDMPTILPEGLVLAACLEREDPRDVFISHKARSLVELPRGASLGTASLRRQAIAKRARPDLRVTPLRGNVETRLRKLDAGEVDATLLALAGLKRLGLVEHITNIMSTDEFLPAVGQGAIGIEVRQDDKRMPTFSRASITPILPPRLLANGPSSPRLMALARRRSPATRPSAGDAVQFRGLIARPDGSAAHDIAGTGQPQRCGHDRCRRLAATSSTGPGRDFSI